MYKLPSTKYVSAGLMLSGIVIIFTLVVSGVLPVLADPGEAGDAPLEGHRIEYSGGALSEPITILLTGIAGWGDEPPSVDVIMLLYFDPVKGDCAAVSIPRDTIVFVPELGWGKLSASYYFGGIEMTRATVEHFTGVPVDYFVELDFQSVERTVDTLGGITFVVDRPISHDGISISPGKRHLSGKEALILLRFRNEPLADIARVGRQQRFIMTFLKRLQQEESKRNLAALLPVFYRYVQTDISLRKTLDFYFAFRDFKNLDQIRFETVPGDFYDWGTKSCWRADLAATGTLIQDIFGERSRGMDLSRYQAFYRRLAQLELEKINETEQAGLENNAEEHGLDGETGADE